MSKPLDPRLLRRARSARTYVLLTSLLTAATTACVVAGAILLARALGPVVTGDAHLADVVTELRWVAALFVVRAALGTVGERFAHRSAVRVVAELREQVLTHAARLGPRWLSEHGADTATLTTRGIDALEPYFVRYLPQLLLTAVLTPAVLVVMAGLDLVAAATVAFTIPLIPVFMWLIGLATQRFAADRLQVQQRLGSQLLDLLAGLGTLQAFGRARGPARRVRELSEASRRTTMQTLKVAFLSGAVLELLATLSVAMVAVGVGLRLVYGELDLVTGLAVLILAPEALLPLRQVGVHFHASADGVAAADAVFEILQTPVARTGHMTVGRVSGVEWAGVSVRAGDRGYDAPADLAGVVRPGRVTALAGPSGSGKTTAAMALLGLIEPDEGAVLVHTPDGVLPLREIDRAAWWAQVSWVPQRPVIEPGTVRENVLGARRVDGETLARAAAATGLDAVVRSMPSGWDTLIGQGGVGLSVGQRQRLALTRGLLDPAAVLVLDEPTAHLDAVSEEHVLATITAAAATGKAVVVIAHRPSLLAVCDDVIQVRSSLAPAAVGS